MVFCKILINKQEKEHCNHSAPFLFFIANFLEDSLSIELLLKL